ncbi:MAG: metallophosphoesterase [Oligoflexia bacterium]|nr:metallophosphoesterase [Oligoflexia bacterium]
MKRHIKLVVSDCHLGTGAFLADGGLNPLEDFRKDHKFKEFLEFYTAGQNQELSVELVINGDFFDMLQARTSSDTPYEIVESIAVYKIRRILKGHPVVIDALKRFIEKGHQVRFIWGNHDAGLWWPGVQEEIKKAIDPSVIFTFDAYEFDGIRIEHGHQYEIMNHFDVKEIFLERGGRTILNYPFGSFFVAGFIAPLKTKRHYISQVVPFSKFLRWAFIFDFWFALLHGIWAFWFFFKMRFIYHPLRFARISKTIQIVYEMMNRPKFAELAPEIMAQHKAQILILGHNHQAAHRHFSDGRQYVNTGTWTDVTSFDPGSLGRLSRPTYGFIEYGHGHVPGDGHLPRVSLRVWKGRHHEWEEFEP